MGSEWRRCRLGDVADINPDSIGPDWPYGHIRYVDISSVGEGVIKESPRRLSLSEAPSRARRLVKVGDTVLSTVRPNRRSMFFVREAVPDMVVSTGFAVLRPRPEIIEPRFLYAIVFDRRFTAYLVSRQQGAAYPAVLPSDIAEAEILLPPLPEQRAIAHILGTLDDKIELNRRMNETLEAMAQALFKSWFVDFDPVVVNALRARNPIPEKFAERAAHYRYNPDALGLPEEILRLFPARFVDSELGPIPEGWKVKRLGDVVTITKGRSYKSKELRDSKIALVTLKSFARGGGYRPDGLKPYIGAFKPEQVVKPGEIVVACTDVTQAAEVIGRPAIVESDPRYEKLVASLDVFIVRPIEIPRAFIYYLLRSDAFVGHALAHTTGTTVLHLSKEAIPSFLFACPSKSILNHFGSIATSLHARIHLHAEESRTLSNLRDTLLPKLISGELRVPDVEKLVHQTT